MKLALACVLAVACGKSAPEPDRWPEVEQLAAPTLSAGDGALLQLALDPITDTDVPEVALVNAIEWRKANGGLPWRGGRTMEDRRPLKAYRLGSALLERRGDDPEAVMTVLYLAQRLRGEAPALIDIMIGFTLATKAATRPWQPAYAPFAPTERELKRSLAADAVFTNTMLSSVAGDEQQIGALARKTYAKMILEAPPDRAGYVKHVEAATTKAAKSDVLKILISPKLGVMLDEQYAAIDAYAKWAQP
jgi:hypothetical protein